MEPLMLGPSTGYNLFFVFMHILLLFTAYVTSNTYVHITYRHIRHYDFLD
jgi:hypothetical protein